MRNKNLKENRLLRALVLPFRAPIKLLSPRLYVKLQYRYITHKKLNLKNPKTFTEKLQKLRLDVYPKNPLVSKCAGRVGVRDYVKEKGYGSTLIPDHGVYARFEDIDFDSLPNAFVLKCSHASGWNIIVKDKSNFDKEAAAKRFKKWLASDYGKKTIEPHYSPVKPEILVEELLLENGKPPTEYKVHVFNGKAKNLYVVTSRGEDIRYTQLYSDWTPFDESQFNGWKKEEICPEKPANWEEMLKICEDLAKPFPFVRVDLYCIKDKIYFSEMTFTPAKGTLRFDDPKADIIMGDWLTL